MASRTVGTSAVEILPQNKLRKSWIIQNEDAAIDVFLKLETPGNLTVSTTDHDHLLGAGGSLALNAEFDGKFQVQERLTAISASGTPRISFFETEDLRR